MSREGLKWVVQQRAADPGTQMLLHLLAFRSDENGDMTPLSLSYLAEHSRQSERSVSRALRDLEEAGVFVREISYSSKGGQRISGRLNFDVSMQAQTISERNAAMHGAHGADDQNSENSDNSGSEEHVTETESGHDNLARPPQGDVSPMSAEVSPNSASGHDNLARPPLYEEKFNNSPKGAGEPAREREADKRVDEEFQDFVKRYPFKTWMSWAEAKREFVKLNAKDREKAVRYAAEYAAALVEGKRRSAKVAADWLRDRDFDGITMVAQGVAEDAGLKRPKVFVISGTPWWDAWAAWHQRHSTKMPPPASRHEGKTGWWFESQYPPKGDTTDPPATAPDSDPNIEF